MPSLNTRVVNGAMRLLVKRRLARMEMTVAEVTLARDRLEAYAARNDAPPGVLFSPTELGGVAAERCTAPGPALPGRTLLYLHGGAYALGSPRVYRRLAWRLAEALCAPVVTIDYRLAPEHSFPAAPDDALAAYEALLDDGLLPRNIAIAGDSAGGNLVLALLQRIRSAGLPMPACAICLSPWADLTGSGDSITLNAHRDPMLPAHRLDEAARLYAPGADLRDPLLSPIFADFEGFPPLSLHVGSTEILLDDAVRVARAAERAGVHSELRIWPAQPHVFQILAQYVPEARQAINEMGRFVLTHWLRAADRALRQDARAGKRRAAA